MKKYAINYNRKIPDNRVPYDFAFYNYIQKKSFLQYFKFTRTQTFSTISNQLPIFVAYPLLAIMTLFGIFTWGKYDPNHGYKVKRAFPSLNYSLCANDENFGTYSNITFRWASDQLGTKDLSFND